MKQLGRVLSIATILTMVCSLAYARASSSMPHDGKEITLETIYDMIDNMQDDRKDITPIVISNSSSSDLDELSNDIDKLKKQVEKLFLEIKGGDNDKDGNHNSGINSEIRKIYHFLKGLRKEVRKAAKNKYSGNSHSKGRLCGRCHDFHKKPNLTPLRMDVEGKPILHVADVEVALCKVPGQEVKVRGEIHNTGKGFARGPIIVEAYSSQFGLFRMAQKRLALLVKPTGILPGRSWGYSFSFIPQRKRQCLHIVVDPTGGNRAGTYIPLFLNPPFGNPNNPRGLVIESNDSINPWKNDNWGSFNVTCGSVCRWIPIPYTIPVMDNENVQGLKVRVSGNLKEVVEFAESDTFMGLDSDNDGFMNDFADEQDDPDLAAVSLVDLNDIVLDKSLKSNKDSRKGIIWVRFCPVPSDDEEDVSDRERVRVEISVDVAKPVEEGEEQEIVTRTANATVEFIN